MSELLKSRKRVLIIGSLMALICILPIILVPQILPKWMFGSLIFLYAFFCSSEINCFAIARDIVETRLAATAAGLMNAMVMISGMIIQPFFAYSLNWFSGMEKSLSGVYIYRLVDFQKALLIIPLFLLVSVIVATFMSDSYAVGAGKKQRTRIRL